MRLKYSLFQNNFLKLLLNYVVLFLSFYRCRSSRAENLDNVGINPHTMEVNGGSRHNRHNHPLPPPPPQSNASNIGKENGTNEQWPKLPNQVNGHDQVSTIILSLNRKKKLNSFRIFLQPSISPTPNRRDKGSPSHSRRNSSSKNPQSRAKSAPQAFGYIKRPNGSIITDPQQQQQTTMLITTNGGRTAHVSAVPRSNKMKVSGGTQTCTSDLQTKIPPTTQHRSFSLTGTSAAQLSQSIRERLSSGTHSLPKPGTELSVFQHR